MYPAVAIADALRASHPACEVQFAGSRERIEWDAVPRAGFPIHSIPAVTFNRSRLLCLANLLLPLRLAYALLVSMWVVLRFRPHIVVGTGGYISLPTGIAALLLQRPLVIQEQNAYPGLANRLLGRWASAVFIAFAEARSAFARCGHVTVCGNPTREAMHNSVLRATAASTLFPELEWRGDTPLTATLGPEKVLLVLGGSLGAEAINRAVGGMLADLGSDEIPQSGLRVVWQTGPRYHEEVVNKLKVMDFGGRRLAVAVVPFIEHMHLAYACADVVVARAGAVTCSELIDTGTPAILIPSPNVTNDHQRKNAVAMMNLGGATMLDERELTSWILLKTVTRLLQDPETVEKMKLAALAAAPQVSPAVTIAKHIIQMQINRAEMC